MGQNLDLFPPLATTSKLVLYRCDNSSCMNMDTLPSCHGPWCCQACCYLEVSLAAPDLYLQ